MSQPHPKRTQPKRKVPRRPQGAASPELRRLEAQVQELLRLCRAQEERLIELEHGVRLGRVAWASRPNLGIDL